MNYKEIRAVYSENTIRVYQAFSKEIAEEAVKKGTFGKNFNLSRMTWIKPSFLWMMYRCGWGTKEKQEYILAIDIKRSAFDYVVKEAVPSTYNESLGISKETWKELVKKSDIRCQWDPERDVNGSPLQYRSLQLGIRGDAVHEYVNCWIENITDITQYVKDLKEKKDSGINIENLLPEEKVYLVE